MHSDNPLDTFEFNHDQIIHDHVYPVASVNLDPS